MDCIIPYLHPENYSDLVVVAEYGNNINVHNNAYSLVWNRIPDCCHNDLFGVAAMALGHIESF